MSDADFLRETAQMMRDQATRVQAVQGAGWTAKDCGGDACVHSDADQPVVENVGNGHTEERQVAAKFMAAWDPTTAVAVADLVEVGVIYANLPGRTEYPQFTAAMAVAKAYRRQP